MEEIPPAPKDRENFWVDTFKATVGDRTQVAKIYYESSGGEERFKSDAKLIAKNVYVRNRAKTG